MAAKNNNLVGKVSPEERDEIKELFERKNGLTELTKTLADSDQKSFVKSSLYDKLIKDMGETSTRFQKWWEDKSRKYKWKGKEGHSWQINFETCEIFLVKSKF